MPAAPAASAAPAAPAPGVDLASALPPNAGPTSAAIAALDGAIVAAFPGFGPLLKDAENTYTKTSYLPLDALLDDVRPALIAQGVFITSSFELVRGGFVITTTLAHSGGGWRKSSFPVGDPSNPQKAASAATYGLRVNLCQLLAIVGRDDDGQASSQPPAAASGDGAPAPQAGAYPPPSYPAPGQPAPQAPPATYQQPPAQPPAQAPAPGYGAPPAGPADPYGNQLPPGAWQSPAPAAPPATPYV
jgi:hypothetical protein